MTDVEKITEAIVSIEDGVINIAFGKINKTHDDFHDRVSVDISLDGNIILVKGHKLDYESIYDPVTEYHKVFNVYKKKLAGFEERIEMSKRFSWFKNLNIENFKDYFSWEKLWFDKFKIVYNPNRSSYCSTKYLYKPEFWEPIEYKSNNWIIKEFK